MKLGTQTLQQKQILKLKRQIQQHNKELQKIDNYLSDASFTPWFKRPLYKRRQKGSDDPHVCLGLGMQPAKGHFNRAQDRIRKIVKFDFVWYDGRHTGGNLVHDVGPQVGRFYFIIREQTLVFQFRFQCIVFKCFSNYA